MQWEEDNKVVMFIGLLSSITVRIMSC